MNWKYTRSDSALLEEIKDKQKEKKKNCNQIPRQTEFDNARIS